jgi:hypothetical protein
MTDQDKANVRSLAVCYHAYNEANGKSDYTGITVWGPMLLRAMELTGVELHSPESVERLMQHAEAQLAARKRVA